MGPHSSRLARQLHDARLHRHPPGPHPHAATPVERPARTARHGGRDPGAPAPRIETPRAGRNNRTCIEQPTRVTAAPGNLLQYLSAQSRSPWRAGAVVP